MLRWVKMRTRSRVYLDNRGRRLKRMSLEQRKALRRQYEAEMPGWRLPIVGYCFSVLMVALAQFATVALKSMLGASPYFVGSLLVLAVLIVATIWGVGPSL